MREVASTVVKTRSLGDTQILAVLDSDDPEADDYVNHAAPLYDTYFPIHEGGMVNALNAAASYVINERPDVTILGFVGDDHRFRTLHWDGKIQQALKRPGYAYGYDGFWQKGEIPTQIFISREIVEALGYFALPDCRHLYVDNAWRSVAEGAGVLHYLSDLYIEHMHPAHPDKKAEWDEGYKRVNSEEMYSHDRAAFESWRASGRFASDVRKVRRVVLAPATIATR
jgi:hypothetical protein